jgi:hypothetical protein
MYEHQIHKTYGFAEAKNKTLILSKAAFKGECENLKISKSKEYVALIPFYGGLPPGVTKDLTVKSIGQGNSLVSPGVYRFSALCVMTAHNQGFIRCRAFVPMNLTAYHSSWLIHFHYFYRI